MKKNARVTSASKSGSRTGAKSTGKTAAKKSAAKASKPVKKPATGKATLKKPAPKKPAKAAPAKKAAAKPAKKAPAKAPVKKVAAKAAPKKAAKPVKKAPAKPAKPAKPAPKAAAPAKAAKPGKVAKPAKAEEKKPAKEKKAAAEKPAAAAKAEPKRRGRKPAVKAEEAKQESAFDDEPNAEALAAAEAEAPEVDEDLEVAEPVVAVKKPKQTRRRRTRQLPRVPPSLRTRPAWAEAWTALAESGLDAATIPAVLRDASLLFIGLGELSPQTTEALFHFWEVQEAPGGIESILEEAFLSQPPQAERKSTLESFFKEAIAKGSIQDALVLLGIARHVSDWRDAAKRLKSVQSPYAEDHDIFSHAREAVG
jgi:hypothetical protein